jgi:hypothetical protein
MTRDHTLRASSHPVSTARKVPGKDHVFAVPADAESSARRAVRRRKTAPELQRGGSHAGGGWPTRVGSGSFSGSREVLPLFGFPFLGMWCGGASVCCWEAAVMS